MSYYSRTPMTRRRKNRTTLFERISSAYYSIIEKTPWANTDPVLVVFLGLFTLFALITLVVGGVLLINYINGLNSSSVDVPEPLKLSGEVSIPKTSEYTRSLQGDNDPAAIAWNGQGRITVLVMGLDLRDYETGGAARTDSMILLSMDPASGTAGMISLPRDLWVTIPGYGEDKLNTAYFKGEIDGLPGGGPGLAVQTVEQFIGMPINYFAEVDFTAFEKFIDEIGGIDIHVQEEMVIDPLGPNNTIFLKPGVQTFNGAQALAYARTRSTEHGDFDRAARQQQVIMAVRDNILNYYSLPKLILKLPALYNDIASGVRTNMTLQDGIRAVWVGQGVKPENIRKGVIAEPDYATASFSYDGQYILLPDMAMVQALRDEVFSVILPSSAPVQPEVQANTAGEPTPEITEEQPPVESEVVPEEQPVEGEPVVEEAPVEEIPTEAPPPEPTVPADPRQAAKAEKASVVILNGTSVSGLANRTHEYLMLKGIKIVQEGNAENLIDYTEIRVSSNKPDTINYLSDLLHVSPTRIFNQSTDPNNPADIVIILGSDWANENPMP